MKKCAIYALIIISFCIVWASCSNEPAVAPEESEGKGYEFYEIDLPESDKSETQGEQKEAPKNLNKFVILIGIEDYADKYIKDLNYAIDDVENLYDTLINHNQYPKSNIFLIKEEEATRQNILKTIETVSKKAINDDSVIIIYYSGHGLTIDELHYLLPYDTVLNNVDFSPKPDTLLSIYDIQYEMRNNPSEKILFWDACRIDYMNRNFVSPGDIMHDLKTLIRLKKVNDDLFIINAGKNGELVFENEEFKSSYMSYFLNEGLKGSADLNNDGSLSVSEVVDFLSKKIDEEFADIDFVEQQKITTNKEDFPEIYLF